MTNEIDPLVEALLVALLMGCVVTIVFHVEFAWWAFPILTFFVLKGIDVVALIRKHKKKKRIC